MKAMMLTDIKKMELFAIPDPHIINPKSVLLRVKSVGVCGSDVHYYRNGKIGDQIVTFPSVLGHECSAVVENVGSEVFDFAPGDLVAIDPAVCCFQCDQCQMGRYHTCRNLKFLAVPGQLQGCLSEFVVMPESNCFKVGKQFQADIAALVEPLSIGFYSVQQAGKIVGGKIGILGVGPIGLSVLQMAKIQIPGRIFCTDKLDYRLEIALKNGADWIGNPDKWNIAKEIQKEEPNFLDAVFECCGQQAAINQAVEILKPGGKLIIVGIPEVDEIFFNINELRRKEITIVNIRRQNECVQPVIDLINSGKVEPNFMITHHFPFHEVATAFELVSAYGDGVVKAVIDMDG